MLTIDIPIVEYECYECGEHFPVPMSTVVFTGEVHCPICDSDDVEVIL
jgi:predicted nucleic acid-binding Zn ribbon protein